jgi:hypothetical protein
VSAEGVRDLKEGSGMSLAKAAELNSHPGPLHVLELAGELGLSAAQRAATESLYAAMRAKAQVLGAKIVEAERDLDRAVAERRIDPKVIHPEDPPLRPERHIPNSIATMRARLINALAKTLPRCSCCGANAARQSRRRL